MGRYFAGDMPVAGGAAQILYGLVPVGEWTAVGRGFLYCPGACCAGLVSMAERVSGGNELFCSDVQCRIFLVALVRITKQEGSVDDGRCVVGYGA